MDASVFLRLCLHGALLSRKKHLSKKHLDKVVPKKPNLDQNINDSKSDICNLFFENIISASGIQLFHIHPHVSTDIIRAFF